MGFGGGDWKALYQAAKSGDDSELRYWLEHGADPNVQHVEVGSTPLIAAAENGHLSTVKILLEKGADPAVRSHWEGETALDAARARGHHEVVTWLETHPKPEE